jgi:hypothetical protein
VKGGEGKMAQANIAATKLSLVFDAGMDKNGKPVYKTKAFNNIKTTATTDQLFQTAGALGALCNDSLESVERNDTFDIIA